MAALSLTAGGTGAREGQGHTPSCGGRNCKTKVPDTTCYYFWHKPFTTAMKVAMENILLIVCPPGFAPSTSTRHMCGRDMLLFCFWYFCNTIPIPLARDEVITLLDGVGKGDVVCAVARWYCSVVTGVNMPDGGLWVSSCFHEGAYRITSKWCLWSIKQMAHTEVAPAGFRSIHFRGRRRWIYFVETVYCLYNLVYIWK